MSTLRRSSSSYGSFADGIIVRGMPLLTLYPGNVYWVDSNGGGGSKGTFAHPVTTLLAAHALCTTDNGDIICVKPGHAESPTAAVDFSKSGFAIIGLGFGDNRPTITNAMAANGSVLDFAGDDIIVYNLKYAEGAPAATHVTIFNVSGDNMHIENCFLEMGAKTLNVLTHDTSEKKGLTFVNNTVYGTVAGPLAGLVFEVTHRAAYISGNKWLLGISAGIDTGCVVFMSGTTEGGDHIIDGDVVLGLGNTEPYLLQTEAQNMSLCMNMRIVGADATDNMAASLGSGFGFINNFVTEEGATVPGIGDHCGARPALVTPTI